MEVSGQLRPPGKEPLVPNRQETGWAPDLVWTRWWREKFSAPAGTRTSDHPARSPALQSWAMISLNRVQHAVFTGVVYIHNWTLFCVLIIFICCKTGSLFPRGWKCRWNPLAACLESLCVTEIKHTDVSLSVLIRSSSPRRPGDIFDLLQSLLKVIILNFFLLSVYFPDVQMLFNATLQVESLLAT
jgi:hypothetical protein